MIHGTRHQYRRGCKCLPCRAANAQYVAGYREDRRAGKMRLGARVSPQEARKRVEQMLIERVKVWEALGITRERQDRRLCPKAITIRKLLKIRRLYRLTMLEDRGRESA